MKKWLFLFIFLIHFNIYAANVPSLYSANIAVDSNNEQLRHRVIQAAFKAVLVKVSGRSSILTDIQQQDPLPNASHYLQDYRYESNSSHEMTLKLRFAKSSIDRLLDSYKLPVWSENRPLVLVWVLKNNQIVGDDRADPVVAKIKQVADTRGVPVIFPILDIADLEQISRDDLWLPMVAAVTKASKRYSPDAVLVVDLDDSVSRLPHAKWTLLLEQQMMRWQTSGEGLIQMGVNNIADALASQFAVSAASADSGEIDMLVVGLHGIADYAKVLRYLNDLESITRVEVKHVTPEEALFHITFLGAVDHLTQQIKLSQVLMPATHDIAQSDSHRRLDLLTYHYEK